ncbi:hypothetical protein IMCC9480_984 [Oxalobacteraceae bacterium IMCC9480]|nr:hypothetical protein IMCC9480_984 [Oxalobacteraceae bacterium IMCC9480]
MRCARRCELVRDVAVHSLEMKLPSCLLTLRVQYLHWAGSTFPLQTN